MNKAAIQKFSMWARTELIAQVSQRAYQYGITAEGYGERDAVTVGGRALSPDEQRQRRELVDQIAQKGYAQVMEEAAYTWFNRFIALRFMEVNNFLPTHIRVFSDSTGAFKPEILNDALHLELPGLNRDKVAECIENNRTEDLYRYLLLTQCNALSGALPGMFERLGGYTELLLPNNILKPDGILGRMVAGIPEEDWTDQVQIIGWLYQYYNAELKDETFALLKKNVKITKERLPSATQLFTPDWIVRYMVENSLGRLFISGQLAVDSGQLSETERIDKEKALADEMGWKYYLPEAAQEPEVRTKLNVLATDHSSLTTLKIIDPCMGSGHILVYAFDVLMQLYERSGVSQRDAAQSILENNLYGLDIDGRAAQLAYFAVMMKARQYDRRIFSRGIQPHVYAIQESNGLDGGTMDYFTNGDPKLRKDLGTLADELRDAKEYGSILNVTPVDFAALYARVEEVREDVSLYREMVLNVVLPLIQTAEAMVQKYDVVVTNPPYMGSSGMSGKLSEFVKKHYPDSKSDLFAVFMERGGEMTRPNGFQAMITQHAWMFLSSYEKLREKLLGMDTVNMVHLGARAFEEIAGEVVQTTSFVLRGSHIAEYKGTYCRLIVPTTQQGKEELFLAGENRYTAQQFNFSKIPGSPVAYWVSENLICDFTIARRLADLCATKKGLATSDNNRFLRLWFELRLQGIEFQCQDNEATKNSHKKWYPLNKGGDFRRWYGNREYVINWENDGYAIRNYKDSNGKLLSRPQNTQYNFLQALTWSKITSAMFSARFCEGHFLFDDAAALCYHAKRNNLVKILGFLNWSIVK